MNFIDVHGISLWIILWVPIVAGSVERIYGVYRVPTAPITACIQENSDNELLQAIWITAQVMLWSSPLRTGTDPCRSSSSVSGQ